MKQTQKTLEWIGRARKKHCDKYDYSKTVFTKCTETLIVICPIHGEFEQLASAHVAGRGCPRCKANSVGERSKKSPEDFFRRCAEKHGDKYDYSKAIYTKVHEKIEVRCNKHDLYFKISGANHLAGSGCLECAKESFREKIRRSKDDFVAKAREIHGGKYDYSKVEYVDCHVKVEIICPEHGSFFQKPENHTRGSICQECSKAVKYGPRTFTTEIFIEKARAAHGDKYDYSKAVYTRAAKHITIICPEHGPFTQQSIGHLSGGNCPKCRYENLPQNQKMSQEEFLEKAVARYGDRFDFSKSVYNGRDEKVTVICLEHGEFLAQGQYLLSGGAGCPSCSISVGEDKIKIFLEKNNINMEQQKSFDGCKYKNKLKFDFYLPDYNMCIEYDGLQHFKVIEYFGSEEGFELTKLRDSIKNEYCKNNNINLLRIPYMNVNSIDIILSKALNLG